MRLSAPANSKTPSSELIRPPSNAAVAFFWQILLADTVNAK
jgi:hypothetical protein